MSLPRMPRPDEVALHVHTTEGQAGPITRLDLHARLEAGTVALDDHFWMEGMGDWSLLSEHPELLEALEAQPEPEVARPGESEDDRMDRIFGDLVRKSWNYLEQHKFASHIDEVFLGAVITSTLDNDYALIDITSDGTHHYLRFEKLEDKSRVIVRMQHLTGSLAVSKVLGQRASVTIGYGEKVGNISKIMGALRAEMKSGYIRDPEPGTITVDGDLNSGYVYCQLDLYFDLEDYVAPDYDIDHERLSRHIAACTHALRKYLRGRFA